MKRSRLSEVRSGSRPSLLHRSPDVRLPADRVAKSRHGGHWKGRAVGSALTTSDFNLFGYSKSIVDIDAEIPDCALNLGMAKQELYRSQVAGAPVDQCCFGPPQGMRAVHVRIKPNGNELLRQKTGVLASCHALPKAGDR